MGAVWIKIVYSWEFVFNLVRPPIFSQKVRYLVNILIPIIRPYYRALVRSALSGTVPNDALESFPTTSRPETKDGISRIFFFEFLLPPGGSPV